MHNNTHAADREAQIPAPNRLTDEDKKGLQFSVMPHDPKEALKVVSRLLDSTITLLTRERTNHVKYAQAVEQAIQQHESRYAEIVDELEAMKRRYRLYRSPDDFDRETQLSENLREILLRRGYKPNGKKLTARQKRERMAMLKREDRFWLPSEDPYDYHNRRNQDD